MAFGDYELALALHMTATHIEQIQRTRETHMSMNRLYFLVGEHLKKLVPEEYVFPVMVKYCKRHSLGMPWDDDLQGKTHDEAIGKQIKATFRLTDNNSEDTEVVSGTVLAVHPHRGILAQFPSGIILVTQVDLWKFS